MKLVLILLFCIFHLFVIGSDTEYGEIQIQMLLFIEDDCPLCDDLFNFVLPELEEKYYLDATQYYTYENDAQTLLQELIKEFGTIDYPAVLIGNQLVTGLDIYDKLRRVVKEYAQAGGCCVPLLYDVRENTHDQENIVLSIDYIYDEKDTLHISANEALMYIEETNPNITINKYDINTENGKLVNNSLCNNHNISILAQYKTPKLFAGEEYLLHKQIDIKAIEMLIKRYQETQ